MLSRLLVDKTSQIRLYEQEHENLNLKNLNLNKENINIFQQNIDLKKKFEKLAKSEYEDFQNSNGSRITINNVKINSINAIQNSQDKTQGNTQMTAKENQQKSNDSDYSDKRENSSGHDSIICTKEHRESIISNVLNTIESCTSSEFRAGLNILDESSFISKCNDVDQINIYIKDSNV
jgi:hypothetical protein